MRHNFLMSTVGALLMTKHSTLTYISLISHDFNLIEFWVKSFMFMIKSIFSIFLY